MVLRGGGWFVLDWGWLGLGLAGGSLRRQLAEGLQAVVGGVEVAFEVAPIAAYQ